MKNILFALPAALLSQTLGATDLYSVNVPNDARPQSPPAMIKHQMKEQQQKGYIERMSLKYQYLNNIEKRAKFAFKGDPSATDMVKNANDIVTASNLKTVPSAARSSTIGFAPIGTFNQESGWTGITEVFKSSIGVCQFSHLDLKASNGGYTLSDKKSPFDINGKQGYLEIDGKINQGFSYEVGWFEELNMYTLSCINKDYSKEFTQKVIELAKQIDNG